MWIKNRIDTEFKKHGKRDLDWSRIAETKIISNLKILINEVVDKSFQELGKWVEGGCDMSTDADDFNDLKERIKDMVLSHSNL